MDDHGPPPPYSETDIYSNAGGSPHPILTPATSHADAASVAAGPLPSAASSVDEAIYTPPYSPTSSIHQNQAIGDDLDHVSSSSATAYFDSRPAHNPYSGPVEVYRITVSHDTEPKDIPYPEALLAKDISEQDWNTFVNHLLPDHVAGVNNDIADRKLRAEMDERMSRLSLGQDDRSRTDISQVGAQLDPLRLPQTPRMMGRVEATVTEWNDGFFKPRGVQISTIDIDAEIAAAEEATDRMPGSWIPGEDDNNCEPSTGPKEGRRASFLGGFMQAGSQGFRMGPIVADNQGFRIGTNGLRADSEGFRIGNMLVADSNGFRLGGSRGFNAGRHGVSLGGRSFNKGNLKRDLHEHFRGRGHHGHRGRSHSHGRHGKGPARSESVDSYSSSSSSSSSDSDSSLDSLPDYEDLRDQQLPLVKQSLLEWLNHPEQPITSEAMRNLKQEIKDAKKENPQQFNQDMKELRNEVKDLMKRFRIAKKEQKKARRLRKEARRMRKVERRAAKKERRSRRREERRSSRNADNCGGRGGRMGPPWAPASLFPHSHIPINCIPQAGNMQGEYSPSMPQGYVPTRPSPPMPGIPPIPGFPFGRGGPGSFMGNGPSGRGGGGPFSLPGMQAMHGGWPFTQGHPYMPGSVSIPRDMYPSDPVSRSAEHIHSQVYQMEESANEKETKAFELRKEATGGNIGEKDRLKMLDEATKLEEEAEKCRREADRLRAEALHLDGELARELEEENGGGQQTRFIPGAFT